MYFDPTTSYQCEHFQLFYDVVENNDATTIIQDWVIDLNNGFKSLSFQMANHSYQAHIYNVVVGIDHNIYKSIFNIHWASENPMFCYSKYVCD